MGFWETILLISSVCLGWRTITDEHKLLDFIRNWAIKKWTPKTKYILDPLIICCACMASVWGSLIYWTVWFFESNSFCWTELLKWIASCLICAFVNAFCWALYELVKKY